MQNSTSQDYPYLLPRQSLDKNISEDISERIVGTILFACALVSVLTTFGIVVIIFQETFGFFQEVSFAQFFLDTKWTPLFAERHFGIWPLINGTFLTTAIAMSVAIPLGLCSAIYLSEFVGTCCDFCHRPNWCRSSFISRRVCTQSLVDSDY
ncbi:hypothetical protein LC612_04730 [Nostoc sp. CHAB 5834]|nr:hypothetical protein [Nostoc sp. CHAB 5834]